MNKLIILIMMLTLVSCGLNSRLEGIELSGISGVAKSDATKGSEVGSATMSGAECTTTSYSLEDDKGGLFEINDEGKILLARDNPPAGTYNLVVIGACDDQTSVTSVQVVITDPVVVAPTASPRYIIQFGSTNQLPVIGSGRPETCDGVALDSLGNIYCAGTVVVPSGVTTTDAFIMKMDPDGNPLWLQEMTTSNSDSCESIAVDSLGNAYCYGNTRASLYEPNGGGIDIFIAKYDPSGNLIYGKQFGANTIPPGGTDTSQWETSGGIGIDASNNIYITGGTNSSFIEANGGGQDIFAMKLDPSGNIIWAKQFGAVTNLPGGSTSGSDNCSDTKVDNSGNLYCAGSTSGSFAEGNAGSNDALVLKLDTNGNVLWGKQIGSSTIVPGGDLSQSDSCSAIDLDSSGNIYCAGGTGGSLGEANAGSTDVFYIKLSPTGNLILSRQFGAVTTLPGGDNTGFDVVTSIGVDSSGSVYLAGSTYGAMGDVNGGMGSDIFYTKFDAAGNLVWFNQLGANASIPGPLSNPSAAGVDRWDDINDLVIDASGNAILVGNAGSNIADFRSSNYDVIILKVDPNGVFYIENP